MENTNKAGLIFKVINKVQKEICQSGIVKDKKNEQQGYRFRGIDDVYNAIAPIISEHGLCILPRMLSRTCEERQTKNGTAIFYVTVEAEFDFVAAEDNSMHTVKMYGEAMDTADKATNKAMSAAYKYACIQSFSIPTEGQNDADATTPEAGQKVGKEAEKQKAAPKPENKPDNKNNNASNVTSIQDKITPAHTAIRQIKDAASFINFMGIRLPKMGLSPTEKNALQPVIKDKAKSLGLQYTNGQWVDLTNPQQMSQNAAATN